jgi:hypothetical protein
MSDWLHDLSNAARENRPLACDGCGRSWDRADMLEAYLPLAGGHRRRHRRAVLLHATTLGWVGPCCASLANRWQP